LLVHICCSVDSHFFLERLQKDYPNETLIGFFYDPNIHPFSEYQLRLLDVKRSCKKLKIELIEGEYDFENWLKAVRGLEKEPEKGSRCKVCFDKRLEVTGFKALELGENTMTTTLLVSPKKSQEQLANAGKLFEEKHGVKFLALDYRAGGGTQEQMRVKKEEQLYAQDYCGCLYGLDMQREQQNKLMDEMFSPINNQILPASIEERLEMYHTRIALEEENKTYKILKQRFLNYRLFQAILSIKKQIIPSYFLFMSTLNNKKAQGRIDFIHNDIHYMNRDEVKLLSIQTLNKLLNKNYKKVTDIDKKPLLIKEELALRNIITNNENDLSSIIIIDKIEDGKIEISINYKIYEDVKEKLLIF
jgi:predicted adenine nucleotide alpha hydrolase (AANH) superfamily ATPase